MKVSLLAVVILATVVNCYAADPDCVYRKIRGLPIHWANPTDCGRFYRCTNKNVKREIICPDDKEYNPKAGRCGPAGRGFCKLSLTAPLADVNVCNEQISGSFVAESGYCRNFYICSENVAYPQYCSDGSYFTDGNCQPDTDSTCWQNFCINEADNTWLSDPTSCQTFYICANQQATKQSCSAGSYFVLGDNTCLPDVGNTNCWENYCISKEDNTVIADVNDCSTYYVCVNQQTEQRSCLSGWYFESTLGICQEDPENSKCWVNYCISKEDNTVIANENDCTSYYVCLNQQTEQRNCLSGWYFDKTLKICQQGECPTPTEPCTCPGGYTEGEFVPHPDDCSLFYICSNKQLIETSCQQGNYFDVDLKYCVRDTDNVCPQCQAETRSKRSIVNEIDETENIDESNIIEEQPETEIEIKTIEENVDDFKMQARDADCTCPGGYEEGDFLPHPSNCSLFYICYDGQLMESNCGKGNYFNSSCLRCEPDTDNTCWPSSCSGGGSTETNLCQYQANGVLVANPTDCNAFYSCLNGQQVAKVCGTGEWFNPQTSACEPDTNASCINPCASTTGIVFLPHPDCTKFYLCNNGQATVETCTSGGFDITLGRCSADALCEATMCANQPAGTTFEYPEDDTKFYLCVNGVAYVKDCITGTYNSAIGVCLEQPSTDCDQTQCASASNYAPFTTISKDNAYFCICRDGQAYKDACPTDTEFNENIGVCYSNAPCDPEICTDSAEYTVAPNRNDTQSFCLCVAESPVIVDCPNNLTFSALTLVCESPPVSDSRCSETFCANQIDYTVFAAISTKEGFCMCVSHIAVFRDCDPGTEFNSIFGACLEPQPTCDVANCETNAGLTFPAYNDPYSFCYCKDEETVVNINCPDGEIYDSILLVCLPEYCDSTQCPGAGLTPFPANNYTNGFCLCNGNTAELHVCPNDGEIFDVEYLACLSESDLLCNIALCADASSSNTYPIPAINDTSSFCYCFGPDLVQVFSCPDNTTYNVEKGICIGSSTNPDDGCTCPGGYSEGDFLPHPTDCNKFYICSDGVLHVSSCGAGNYYNINQQACMLDSQNLCSDTSCTCVGTYRENELIAYPQNSQMYYRCLNSQLQIETCATGYTFSALQLQCTTATTYNSKKVRPFSKRSIDVDDFFCIENEKRSVPSNCSQYEVCVENKWRKRTCTDLRYYNPEQQKCLEPRDDTVCNYAKVSGLPDCNNQTEHLTLPSRNGNCAQYFRCTHGKWRLRTCTKPQLYSRNLQTCVTTNNEKICQSDEKTSLEFKQTLTEIKKECRHTAVRYFAGNCAMYLMCLENEWWYQYCPFGMYFNLTFSYCMPNNAAQCSDAQSSSGVIAGNINRPEIINEYANQSCSHEGLLRASAQLCDKYYVCIAGKWHPQNCNTGNYYNVTMEKCIPDREGVCAELSAICLDGEKRTFPLNCTAYEVCQAGNWQRASCSPMWSFDDVLGECIPNDGRCAGNGLRRACHHNELQQHPLSENCTQFYYCLTDSWQIGTCLKGYTFTKDYGTCVPHTAENKCNPIVDFENHFIGVDVFHAPVNLSPENNACLGQEDGSLAPHATDCNHFYLCLNEIVISEQICSTGSFFDADLAYCRPNDGSCRIPLTGACENATDNSFVANPLDCRAYYHCSTINGTQLLYCPEGEYYHNYTRQCRVDVGQCQKPIQQNKCANATHGTRLEHETYCNIYYACVRGLAIPVECPDNYIFNSVLAQCIYDEIQECQNGELVNGNGTAHSCANFTDGSFLPDHTDCTRYYICSAGVALPQRCTSGAYFDSTQLLCVPDDGSCPFVDDDEPNNHPVPPDPTVCEGKHGTLLPDPLNCNEFYVCVNGKLKHERCYEDYFFNTTISQCQAYIREDTAVNEAATSREQENIPIKAQQQCSDKPTDFSDLCSENAVGTSIAEQGDCRRYISCEDNVPTSQRCRNGESYDSLLGLCRQNDGTCMLENGQRFGVCNGKHGQLTRDTDSCRGYFVCINGQKIPGECGEEEYFNKTTNTCLKDTLKQCSSTPTTSEETPSVSCIGLSESVLYPYIHDNCRSYFQCVRGTPKIHECADGLFYNATTTRCVKEIAKCVMPPQSLQRAPIDYSGTPSKKKICEQSALDFPYANKDDHCRSFYICRADHTIAYTDCPEGTLFNNEKGLCMGEEYTICMSD
ncbi:uncharacterized protein LOC119665036 [Teleopsis dalmanni]|uniref:uncharacterized protein LOC119665036 n=1 Tax=Teleopsis dalmanni TaxID=139649 RepID=UPI0018CFDBD7|nr:uncharacterized protein LOC119665036 [Teleopsis dalmanni]